MRNSLKKVIKILLPIVTRLIEILSLIIGVYEITQTIL